MKCPSDITTAPVHTQSSTMISTLAGLGGFGFGRMQIDFGMNAQEAVDAGRFHHQWLPDRIVHERHALSPDSLALLRDKGHQLAETERQGSAEVIVLGGDGVLEGGVDRRKSDGGSGIQ